jgi:hypothetical protein
MKSLKGIQTWRRKTSNKRLNFVLSYFPTVKTHEREGVTMNRSFAVVVERDPESHWLVGEVVELPGCYTQAPDLPTLETNSKENYLP